jgi:hypothetical protein
MAFWLVSGAGTTVIAPDPRALFIKSPDDVKSQPFK